MIEMKETHTKTEKEADDRNERNTYKDRKKTERNKK